MFDPQYANHFHQQLRELATVIRNEFAERDQSNVTFAINVYGDPHGELNVEYRISNHSYDDNRVKGNRLDSVIDEFFRRKGWDLQHKPEALTYSGDIR